MYWSPIPRLLRQVVLVLGPFLRVTMLGNHACRVNRLVQYSANFEIFGVFSIERLPMFQALNIVKRWKSQSCVMHTFNSPSLKSRISYVKCSLKQPVPNALAPSTPALVTS
jgi:hypothetical protein